MQCSTLKRSIAEKEVMIDQLSSLQNTESGDDAAAAVEEELESLRKQLEDSRQAAEAVRNFWIHTYIHFLSLFLCIELCCPTSPRFQAQKELSSTRDNEDLEALRKESKSLKEEVSKLNQRALEAEVKLEDTSEQLRQARRAESERVTLPTSVLPIPEASTSSTTLSQVRCQCNPTQCHTILSL